MAKKQSSYSAPKLAKPTFIMPAPKTTKGKPSMGGKGNKRGH